MGRGKETLLVTVINSRRIKLKLKYFVKTIPKKNKFILKKEIWLPNKKKKLTLFLKRKKWSF